MRRTATSVSTLTERDLAIIAMVYSFDGCTSEQIKRLYFPESTIKACSRRLNKLIESDLLDATLIVSQSGFGQRFFLTVGKQGRGLVADRFGATRSQLARATTVPSASQMPHHLAIVDFRISLIISITRAGLKLDWVTERSLRRQPFKVEVTH